MRPADFGIGDHFFSVGEAVVIGNATTGYIEAWSPGAERLFGYSRQEAEGQLISLLVPAELLEAHRVGLVNYAEGGTPKIVDTTKLVELPALHKDGHRLWVQLTLTAVDGPTRDRYVMAVIRDATATHEQQSEAQDRLAAAWALRDEVAGLRRGIEVSRRWTRVLVTSVALDLLLSAGLIWNGVRTNDALAKARASSAVTRLNCLSANEAKRNEKQIWDALFASQTPEQLAAQTPEQREQSARIRAVIDDATRQQNCERKG